MRFKSPKAFNPAFKEPTIRTWLEKLDLYFELSGCREDQRIPATAILLEGAAITWYNGIRRQVENGQRRNWDDYAEFREELITAFEPMSEVERARTAIRNLRQMGRVATYVQKFRDLRFRIPDMSQAEAFSHFMAGLKDDIRKDIGVHVTRNDVEGAIAMAEKMDCYQSTKGGKSGSGSSGSRGGSGGFRKPSSDKKGGGAQLHAIKGATTSDQGSRTKKNKGRGERNRRQRDRKCSACHETGHWISDCPLMARLMKTVRDEKQSKN